MGEILEVRNGYRMEQWRQIIQDCRENGLSNKLYCEQHGLSEKRYYSRKFIFVPPVAFPLFRCDRIHVVSGAACAQHSGGSKSEKGELQSGVCI